MNLIYNILKDKSSNNLSIYFTAGFPGLHDTTKVIQELSNAKVDFIEVGLPYSDPLADGPTIQKSSQKALQNGINEIDDLVKETGMTKAGINQETSKLVNNMFVRKNETPIFFSDEK